MIKSIFIIILFILYECKRKIYLSKSKLFYFTNEFIVKIKVIIFNQKSSFHEYLDANKTEWKKIDNCNSYSKNKILVSNFVGHPGYTLTECLLGKYLSKISTFETIGLLSKKDWVGKKIFKSFNINEFYLYDDTNLLKKLKILIKVINILKSIDTVDKFINLEFDQIDLGKITYDHYIRYTGIPSENKINLKFYFMLVEAFFIHEFCKKIFDNTKFSILVATEIQFIPAAIMYQNALKYGVNVYSRDGGPNIIGVRKFTSISERYDSWCKYPKSLIDFASKKYLKYAIEKGGEIIEKRFSNQPLNFDTWDAKIAHNKKLKLLTRKELCSLFNWDVSKPIACIFGNDLIDGNFITGKRRLFRENMTWLKDTLKEIRNIKNINWIVKDHPPRPFAGQSPKITLHDVYHKICGDNGHIKLLPNDIGGSSLRNIISLAVTSVGMPGVEYPCLGVPSLIAGETFYAGLDFTIEPQTQDEYFSYLHNIKKIPKLTMEQINKAKIFIFVQLILTKCKHPLLPELFTTPMLYATRIKLGKEAREKFWHESKNLIKNFNIQDDKFMKMIKNQYINNNQHLINLDIK